METIKLDLIPGKKMPSLHASQYDDGRDYHIDLTENRVPYVLDGTETISVIIRKCDNTLVSMDIANTFADKSYIEFEVVEQMTACSGFNYGEIILEKNGDRIGSLNFYLQVEGAPDEGGITSQSEINNLNRQITDEVDRILPDMVDEIAEPIIRESVPPIVEELVPSAVEAVAPEIIQQAIGDNYYNKTQTDAKVAGLIDDSQALSNKTWSSDKTTKEVAKAIDNVTNWRVKEKFDGTYTDWLTNNNVLSHNALAKTAVISMVNGAKYHVFASGTFNRFILKTVNSLTVGAIAGNVYTSTSPTSPMEYTFENEDNAKYLLVTVDYNGSTFNCSLSVEETTQDDPSKFTVNGISVLLEENLNGYLRTITDGNFLSNADFTDSDYCLNHGKIDASLIGKTILCPMKNGLKYSISVSGAINKFIVGVADNNTPNTPYTVVYNASIWDVGNRNISLDYVNSENKKYLLVFYYLGTPETTINKSITELSYNGKMTVNGIEVALKENVPLTYDNYMSNLSVDSVTSVSDLYALYDDLVAAFPNYISKNVLGQDSSGNNIVEYVLTSGNYNSQAGYRSEDLEIAKPKILIVTGIHGDERSSVMATYQFVRDLCNAVPKITDIRENYILKIVPCVCPTGFNSDSRVNSNGVNINRNFADYWTYTGAGTNNYSGASVADQLETQIIQSWINANNDAILYVDFHNSGFDNEVSYIQGSNTYAGMSDIKGGYLKQVYMTSAYWKEVEAFASNLIFAYTGGEDQMASSTCYAHITGGLLSILLEASWNQNGTGKHSRMTIKTGTEALGNMLIGILKAL